MAIRVEKLTKKFGDFVAVDSIDFDVPDGQIFGFLGPNGSGKTTTIRMLLGLLVPTDGTAYVLDTNVRQATRKLLGQLGYMSQKFSLYSDLTVVENLRFFGHGYGLRGKQLQQRIAYVVEMAGLKGHENSRTDELSGGWAQRLALGAAIMHRPRLVFLDEPTAGVDPISRREFWDLLYRLSAEGTTLFVTTHYMDEAEHCESVGFIYYGNIIAHGSPSTIVDETIPGDVLSFEPADPPKVRELIQDAVDRGQIRANRVSLFGAAVRVTTTDLQATQAYLQTQFQIEQFQIEQPTLEDAFIELVHKADNHVEAMI